MALSAVVAPLSLRGSIRAAADVSEFVDDDPDDPICATVHLKPGHTPAARLNVLMRETPHWGDVLEWTMLKTTGMHGTDRFFVCLLSDLKRPPVCLLSVLYPFVAVWISLHLPV